MSRRFIPPAIAALGKSVEAELAQAVMAAREQGFTEGRLYGLQEGQAAGRSEGEAEVRETLQAQLDALRAEFAKRDQQVSVAGALDRVLVARAADLAALEHATRKTAGAALRALFPVLLSHAAGEEIAALLRDALTDRPAETLRLRAHPDTLATIATETDAPHPEPVVIEPDPSLAPGAAEIAWTGGGLSFDPHALLERVVAVLEAVPPPPPTPEPSKEPNE